MTFKVVIEEGGKYTTLALRKVRSRGVKPYRDPLPYSAYVWDEKRALAKYYSYYGDIKVGTLMSAQNWYPQRTVLRRLWCEHPSTE